MRKTIFLLVVLLSVVFAKVSPRGLENALDISASGIMAQRTKAQILAENIANIDTLRTADGLPYRRKVVTMRSAENFSRTNLASGVLQGVVVTSVSADMSAFQKVYSPGHPDADAQGYVLYPNVELTKELVDLTQASGAFENNVVVFNNTKAMMKSSLELAQ